MKSFILLFTIANLSLAVDAISDREALDFPSHHTDSRNSGNGWFVHHLARQDFPLLESDKLCERVTKFALETYQKPAHELGLKAGVWIRMDNRCALRVLMYPAEEGQLAAYHKFIEQKQDQTFEDKQVHVYLIRSVHSDLQLTSGIKEEPGEFFTKVVARAWRPSAFRSIPEFRDYIVEEVGPKYLRTLESDPKPFLDYVANEFSSEYAKKYEEFLRQSNALEFNGWPSLGLDDGTYEPYAIMWSFMTRCKTEFPTCRLGK